MKEKVEKPYEKDEFFRKWLVGLSERTKENYSNEFNDWFVIVGMTPTEQIKKRMHDLTTENITERTFFEDKFRAYKEYLENRETKNGTLKPGATRALSPTLLNYY